MSRSAMLIAGIVALVAAVLFIASLIVYDSAQFSVRGPSGDEAVLSFRYSERGGDSGFFTRIAIDINQFFSDFGWYRDLSRAWFELGEPLRILLNWLLGGFWAMVFLARRR